MKRLLSLVCWCLLSLLTGCAHYQLGTGSKPSFSSLYIEPVRMEASIPQAQALLTTQLRNAFMRDGRLRLAGSADEADAVLRITIAGYRREVATQRTDDTGLARRYNVLLTASATLQDHRRPQPLFTDRPLEVQRGILTDSGQVQAEYQNLPLLAEDLARRAVHAVLDTW